MSDEKAKTCFIIMSITTPEAYFDKYRDEADHFKHVLQCLFIPSVEKAGFKPITPIAKGSDLIQAEIIRNLEKSDIVLCDMSCLNPNVFFEFGIRTSLNKPVCVVKDEHTKKVPFDTGILNHQEYRSTIDPWELSNEIQKLSEHLRISYERSNKENSLWKYFAFRSAARPYEGETGAEAKLDYLAMQLESLRKQISSTQFSEKKTVLEQLIANDIEMYLPENVFSKSVIINEDLIELIYEGSISANIRKEIRRYVTAKYKMRISFKQLS